MGKTLGAKVAMIGQLVLKRDVMYPVSLKPEIARRLTCVSMKLFTLASARQRIESLQ